MKNTIAFIVGVLAIVAGAGYIILGLQDRAEKAELWQAVQEARVETARQMANFIQGPEDKVTYDRQQFIRKHLDLVEAAYKAHPTAKPKEDQFIADLEEKAKEGKKDKAKTAEYRERYDLVKKIWNEQLKTGGYKPVLSAYDHGVRLDILSMKQSNDGGQQGVRMDVLIWGGIKDQFNAGPLSIQSVIDLDDKETSGKNRGKPKQGLVKVDGSATPYVLVEKPWEWIPEWPPGVMYGYYIGLPLFHPKASKYNFSMGFTQRTQGGTMIPVEFKWKDLAIDPAVKGAPGSSWDAPVEAVDEEQLKEAGIGADEDKKDEKKDGKDKKDK